MPIILACIFTRITSLPVHRQISSLYGMGLPPRWPMQNKCPFFICHNKTSSEIYPHLFTIDGETRTVKQVNRMLQTAIWSTECNRFTCIATYSSILITFSISRGYGSTHQFEKECFKNFFFWEIYIVPELLKGDNGNSEFGERSDMDHSCITDSKHLSTARQASTILNRLTNTVSTEP